MKLYLMFFMLNFFYACNGDEIVNNFIVIRYQKVSNRYVYSKDILKYKGDTYKPLISAEYIKGTLANIYVYKSEGKVGYNREALQSDTLFKASLDQPEQREIKVSENVLIDVHKTNHITEIKNDSIFCINQDTLLLYIH